jgi:hypothetical protein
VLFGRRDEGVKPLHGLCEISHASCRSDILDAQRQYRHPVVIGLSQFTRNLLRGVGVRREDKNHELAFGNRLDDCRRPEVGDGDIARRNPTTDILGFERGEHGLGDRSVFFWVTDENVERHARIVLEKRPAELYNGRLE